MHSDGRPGLQTLEHAECRALLSRSAVGRVVHTDRALPAVRLVDYVLDGDDVVLQPAPGRLAEALVGAVVALQVDDLVPGARTGWSVTVTGQVARDASGALRLPLQLVRGEQLTSRAG